MCDCTNNNVKPEPSEQTQSTRPVQRTSDKTRRLARIDFRGSRESIAEYQAKLQERKKRTKQWKRENLIVPETNGFYADRKYYEAIDT